MPVNSKPLGHDDVSGFEFANEMLDGNPTAAVNIERVQYHPKKGFIIFEYLKCEERNDVTPHSSHPNRYWHKNKSKFLALWRITKALKATLYLVNYAGKGTKYEDEILLIEVLDMDENQIVEDKRIRMTRKEFKTFFRRLNTECLGFVPCAKCGSPMVEKVSYRGRFLGCSDYKKNGCDYIIPR